MPQCMDLWSREGPIINLMVKVHQVEIGTSWRTLNMAPVGSTSEIFSQRHAILTNNCQDSRVDTTMIVDEKLMCWVKTTSNSRELNHPWFLLGRMN
jgi:hypothetical protein